MDKNVISSIGRDKSKKRPPRERRAFKIDSSGEEFFIAPPSAESIRQSDWVYSKVYSQAMSNDILTTDQMVDVLKKRGILSAEYDQELLSVRKNIGESLEAMALSKDLDEKEGLAIKVSGLREELFLLNQKINGPVSNTCEQIAEDAKIDFLTSHMIEDIDGNKVWVDYDEYSTDSDYEKVLKSRIETMLYIRNVDSNFLDSTPENLVLREITAERKKQLEATNISVEPVVPDVTEQTVEPETIKEKPKDELLVSSDEVEIPKRKRSKKSDK